MIGRRRDGGMTGMIPLLDTLFLLLFALLAAAREQVEPAVDPVRIRLPEVTEGSDGDLTGATVKLLLDRDGQVFLGEQERAYAAGEFSTLVEDIAALHEPSEVSVEIYGDQDAGYGRAVQLLQELRLRGFARVALLARGSGDLVEQEIDSGVEGLR